MKLMPQQQLVVVVVLLLVSLCGNNVCNANAIRIIQNIVARKAIAFRLPAAGKLLRRTAKNGRKVNVENRVFEDLLWGPSSFFTWDASIDGTTGVASSKERSGPFALTKKTTTSSPQSRKRQRKRRIMEEERLVIETSRKCCATWPDFLCQGSVSFGFLRCVKTEKKIIRRSVTTITKRRNIIPNSQSLKTTTTTITKSMVDDRASSSLRSRFLPFPLTFLEFGKMTESSSNDNNYKNHNDDDGLVVLGSWDIPLNDGLLILQQKPHQQQQLQRFNNYYRGKLTFAIAKTKKTPHGRGKREVKDDDEESSPRYQIITRIVDYQPWLAGGGWSSSSSSSNTATDIASTCDNTRTHIEPTRRLRHAVYLSTQSVVHAYMTWRFHRTWRNKLNTALMIEN
jgi:hypothetical protein